MGSQSAENSVGNGHFPPPKKKRKKVSKSSCFAEVHQRALVLAERGADGGDAHQHVGGLKSSNGNNIGSDRKDQPACDRNED